MGLKSLLRETLGQQWQRVYTVYRPVVSDTREIRDVETHIKTTANYISTVYVTECVFFLQKMDKNRDGVVTLEEFILSCQEVTVLFPLGIYLKMLSFNFYILKYST